MKRDRYTTYTKPNYVVDHDMRPRPFTPLEPDDIVPPKIPQIVPNKPINPVTHPVGDQQVVEALSGLNDTKPGNQMSNNRVTMEKAQAILAKAVASQASKQYISQSGSMSVKGVGYDAVTLSVTEYFGRQALMDVLPKQFITSLPKQHRDRIVELMSDYIVDMAMQRLAGFPKRDTQQTLIDFALAEFGVDMLMTASGMEEKSY